MKNYSDTFFGVVRLSIADIDIRWNNKIFADFYQLNQELLWAIFVNVRTNMTSFLRFLDDYRWYW